MRWIPILFVLMACGGEANEEYQMDQAEAEKRCSLMSTDTVDFVPSNPQDPNCGMGYIDLVLCRPFVIVTTNVTDSSFICHVEATCDQNFDGTNEIWSIEYEKYFFEPVGECRLTAYGQCEDTNSQFCHRHTDLFRSSDDQTN